MPRTTETDGLEPRVRHAELVVPCSDLAATLTRLTEHLGFRLEAIFPADDPRVAVVAGHGTRLRLEREPGHALGREARRAPFTLRLVCEEPGPPAEAAQELGDLRVQWVPAEGPLDVPALAPSFTLTRGGAAEAWKTGRADMRYRDLLPDRHGGRFIASHIRIEAGGEVPDYVHYHLVGFQLLVCLRGWVRVVYEDQGPAFVMEPGDVVVQPPGIRHRVLESSPSLEVLELGSPAEHETRVDHELLLPTGRVDAAREFGGQRFLLDRAERARWRTAPARGYEVRETAVRHATAGQVRLCLLRTAPVANAAAEPPFERAGGELLLRFLVAGGVTLERAGATPERLGPGDACSVPPGEEQRLVDWAPGTELLEFTVPAAGRDD